MHNVDVKGILSNSNGMNIYRGCSHGCIYCDARSTCYQMDHDFEDIEVKQNAPELLELALRKKRKKCMIGTGSMSDPYVHIEKDLMLTRRCLEIIDEYGFGVTVLTKSDMILRDLDLLKRINSKTKCVVQMTLTTADEELCKKIEPNICTTKHRFEVLKVLQEENIPTVCWFSPILPFINDTEDNIEGIVEYCAKAGTYGIMYFGAGVTLRDGDRQYFYKMLDENFKGTGLKEKYIERYANAYEIASPNTRELSALFRKRCKQNNIECNSDKLFNYLHEFHDNQDNEQLKLFDFLK